MIIGRGRELPVVHSMPIVGPGLAVLASVKNDTVLPPVTGDYKEQRKHNVTDPEGSPVRKPDTVPFSSLVSKGICSPCGLFTQLLILPGSRTLCQ